MLLQAVYAPATLAFFQLLEYGIFLPASESSCALDPTYPFNPNSPVLPFFFFFGHHFISLLYLLLLCIQISTPAQRSLSLTPRLDSCPFISSYTLLYFSLKVYNVKYNIMLKRTLQFSLKEL